MGRLYLKESNLIDKNAATLGKKIQFGLIARFTFNKIGL
jgi:hypothetical protein